MVDRKGKVLRVSNLQKVGLLIVGSTLLGVVTSKDRVPQLAERLFGSDARKYGHFISKVLPYAFGGSVALLPNKRSHVERYQDSKESKPGISC
jgi:hypothetical protein